jgi:radical SAM superfamily enzyme YgiQ (UPF0313 family)
MEATTVAEVRGVLSSSLVCALTFRGPSIAGFDGHPEIVLGHPQLVILTALAATGSRRPVDRIIEEVAHDIDVPVGGLRDFVDALAQRGLLDADGSLPSRPGDDAPDRRTTVVDDIELPAGALVLAPVITLKPTASGFCAYDHEGCQMICLSPREVVVADLFRLPASLDDVVERAEALGTVGLPRDEVVDLVRRLLRVRLIEQFDPSVGSPRDGGEQFTAKLREAIRRKQLVIAAQDHEVEKVRDEMSNDPRLRTKVAVVPVADIEMWATPPLALGMLVAYAKVHDGGRLNEQYRFHPRWVSTRENLAEASEEPAIFFFSNYMWCHAENLALSAYVKQLDPANVTIHGGPDTPAYAEDNERYFRENPHVDITVRGEGEVTFAEILAALDGRLDSLDVLADVAGLSYRSGDAVVRTSDRERIKDLDSLPSPYLTGLFDVFSGGGSSIIIETNRGCPYGCTFCDWGSATLSRIRKFDLDRVLAELDWCAENQFSYVGCADANFGIFERDVTITEKVVELKQRLGYPIQFTTNYAKNTVKHLRPIIETLASAGILTAGKVSLQSMDKETLLTIKRSNIKVEKYDALTAEFRQAKLPLYLELMMGLPGATVASLTDDLQQCIDRSIAANVYPTFLLPNSPMNDPAYRQQHGITARAGEFLTETTSYTRDDYRRMEELKLLLMLNDKYGILRHVGLYLRQEAGLRQIDFYARVFDDIRAHPNRWPTIRGVMLSLADLMAPPGTWRWFIDEVRDYVVSNRLTDDDAALETVLAVQHALIPAPGREFPSRMQLAHDYAAWHGAVDRAKDLSDPSTWPAHAPHLREFGPAEFVVDDPLDVCTVAVGRHMTDLDLSLDQWELDSPVARSAPMALGASA